MHNTCLEHFYAGDAAWNRFAGLHMDGLSACAFQDRLCKTLNRHADIAAVVFARFGPDALTSISKPVPALGGRSIEECTRQPILVLRLKECLMRMP